MNPPQLSLRRLLSTTLSVFLAAGLGLIGPVSVLAEGVERGGLNFTIVSDEISGTAHGSVPEVQANSTSPDSGSGSDETLSGTTDDGSSSGSGSTSGSTDGTGDGSTGTSSGDTTSESTDGTYDGDTGSGYDDGTSVGDTTAGTGDTLDSGNTESGDSGSTSSNDSGSTSAELNAKGKSNNANGKKTGQR